MSLSCSAPSRNIVALALQVLAHGLAIDPEPARNLADRKSLVLQFVNHHKFPLLDHVRTPWRIFVNPTIEAIFFGIDFLPANGQKVNPSLTVTGYFQSELWGYLNRN